jgi:hypothetical protein
MGNQVILALNVKHFNLKIVLGQIQEQHKIINYKIFLMSGPHFTKVIRSNNHIQQEIWSLINLELGIY